MSFEIVMEPDNSHNHQKHYKPMVLWIVIPVLMAGLVFSVFVVQYWGPKLIGETKARVESELKLASKLGIDVCDNKFSLIMESRLENDAEALEALRKESLEEIRSISRNFHKIWMLVVDKKGNVVTSSFPAFVVKRISTKFQKGIQPVRKYNLAGREVRAHVRYFPFWGWYIVAFIDEKDFQSPLLFVEYAIYGGSFGVFLVMLSTLIFTYVRYINKPLMSLVKASRDVSEGRFVTVPVPHQNELGLVADSFNRMVKRLERNRSELFSVLDALKQSEQFLNAILESIQDGIIVFGKDLRVRYANSVVKEWLGGNALIVGKTCYEILSRYGGDMEECELIKGTLESGVVNTAVVRGIYGSDVEWFEVFCYPIKENLNGGVVGVVELKKDITEKRRIAKALQEREELYRTLVESSFDGIVMLNMKRQILSCNQAFLNMFGFSEEEIVGKSARLIHPSDESFYNMGKIYYPRLIRDGSYRLEWELARKDGTRIDVEIVGSLIKDSDGNNVGIVSIVRDVTERKAFEERISQLQKMEAIGRLAGGIAHDFNNLLQVILGYVQILLMDKSPDDPDYQNLKVIEESAHKGKELVQQILAFSRSVETNFKLVNLNNVVEHTVNILRRTMPRTIDIKLELFKELGFINANPVQIEQVIINLAVNAQDAMPEGGTLSIATGMAVFDEEEIRRLSPDAKPGKYVFLKVSDTGTGIDESVIGRIFEPFFTTKEVGKGSGLGLAVVYGIVRSHGGFINCVSELGTGTTFKIYFPLQSVASKEGVIIESSEQKAIYSSERKGTILLVDDEEMIRIMGKEILERAGYEVLLAKSGKEAIKMYEKVYQDIDLVILDLNMPGISGISCLMMLRDINPSVNVIIASGYIDRETIRKAMDFGARTYLEKPFTMNRLLEVVYDALV